MRFLIVLLLISSCSSNSKNEELKMNENLDHIRTTLIKHIPTFRDCHARAGLNREKKNLIHLEFTIKKDGNVSNPIAKSKNKKIPKGFLNCLERSLETIKFSPPPNGGVIDVSQPLNF